MVVVMKLKLNYKFLFIFLFTIFIKNFLNGEIVISLNNNGEALLKESNHNILEHSITEYYRYFLDYYEKFNCSRRFDLQITPFYDFLKLNNNSSKASFNNIGALLQGNLNIKNFWLRGNLVFSNVREKFKIEQDNEISRSRTNIDNLLLKFGYNFYSNRRFISGIYLLIDGLVKKHYKILKNEAFYAIPEKIIKNRKQIGADFEKLCDLILDTDELMTLEDLDRIVGQNTLANGIPLGSKKLKALEENFNKTKVNLCEYINFSDLILETPNLGNLNNKIGFGLNFIANLYECDNKKLSMLFDGQYYYSVSRCITNAYQYITTTSTTDQVETTKKSSPLEFTPGHTLNFWLALNYDYKCYNFEAGANFSTTFGEKLKIKNLELTPAQMKKLNEAVKIRTVEFNVEPYIAISYNNILCGSPTIIGLGIGYEYNKIRIPQDLKIPDKLNGISAWLSFERLF